MKKSFEEAKLELIRFNIMDVIVTSDDVDSAEANESGNGSQLVPVP